MTANVNIAKFNSKNKLNKNQKLKLKIDNQDNNKKWKINDTQKEEEALEKFDPKEMKKILKKDKVLLKNIFSDKD